jgi:hypothetical protein
MNSSVSCCVLENFNNSLKWICTQHTHSYLFFILAQTLYVRFDPVGDHLDTTSPVTAGSGSSWKSAGSFLESFQISLAS